VGDRSPYSADAGAGWLLYVIPESGDASDAALTWGEGAWVPEGLPRERLAGPAPTLSLSFEGPATATYPADGGVDAPAAIDLTYEVTNEGEHDTWFVGALNRSDFVEGTVGVRRRRVPAGETVTWTDTETVPADRIADFGGEDPQARYRLEWAGDRRTVTVDLVADSLTSRNANQILGKPKIS
jgi:hypothetical protein